MSDKNTENNYKRDTIIAARVLKCAECVGVSPRYVRYVIDGERNNDKVFSTFMEIQERENALIIEVKKLVPFF